MEAHRKEYHGFKDWNAVRIGIPPRGEMVIVSTTRTVTEYKVEQGVLQKRKERLCALGDQQAYGINDSYSSVLTETEIRLLTAIAAEHISTRLTPSKSSCVVTLKMMSRSTLRLQIGGWNLFRRGMSYKCSRQSMERFRLLGEGTRRSRLGWRMTNTVR